MFGVRMENDATPAGGTHDQGATILPPYGGPSFSGTRRGALHSGTNIFASEFICGGNTEEADMPAIFIPVLWVGGAAILLGGGCASAIWFIRECRERR
jgi:hypothetical protein